MFDVVEVVCVAHKEPVLARLRREYIQSLLVENEALRASLTATRIAVAESWGYDLASYPVLIEPVEVATPTFEAKRGMAEGQAFTSFRKFFSR